MSELLELVGLGHAVDRYPHQLSGGMQQRVALAARWRSSRGCCCSTSRSRLSTRRYACSCARRSGRIQLELGITTLYVTHDQEEALAISDHVAVMYRGRIEQMGTPAQMYGAPATPFVAEFIGTMNRLESTCSTVQARCSTATRGSSSTLPAGGRPESACSCSCGPRSCSSKRATDGAAAGANVLSGTVLSQTFLGSVTRVKVTTPETTLISDMSAGRAEALPVGARVTARVPRDEARLISLPDEGVTFSAQDLESQ